MDIYIVFRIRTINILKHVSRCIQLTKYSLRLSNVQVSLSWIQDNAGAQKQTTQATPIALYLWQPCILKYFILHNLCDPFKSPAWFSGQPVILHFIDLQQRPGSIKCVSWAESCIPTKFPKFVNMSPYSKRHFAAVTTLWIWIWGDHPGWCGWGW